MYGSGTTSGRTGVMMVVGSVQYINKHRVKGGRRSGEVEAGREVGMDMEAAESRGEVK